MSERAPADLDELLGRVLTIGSQLTMLLLAAGFTIAIWAPDSRLAALLIHLGLLALMVTPVARVATTVIAFGRARQWLLVTCTTLVLVLLLVSFLTAFLR